MKNMKTWNVAFAVNSAPIGKVWNYTCLVMPMKNLSSVLYVVKVLRYVETFFNKINDGSMILFDEILGWTKIETTWSGTYERKGFWM